MRASLLLATVAILANGCVWTPVTDPTVSAVEVTDPAMSPAQVALGQNRFPVPVGDRFGYIDRLGELVISARFENAGVFSEGLARVLIDGFWGFIDPHGTVVIEPRYLSAGDFSQGRASVALADAPDDLYSRQARAEDRRLRAYINAAGVPVIGPEFSQAREFAATEAGALAVAGHVRIGRATPLGLRALAFLAPTFRTRVTWMAVEPDGTPRFAMRRAESMLAFSDGLAAFQDASGFLRPRGKWGYVDTAGEVVIPPRFDRARSFSEGLAAVAVRDQVGYIDTGGEWAVPPRFDDGRSFADDRARVSVDGRWGYIDRGGTLAIAPQYDVAMDFSEGLAVVRGDGRFGFIQPDGQTAIDFRFDFARPFRNGLAYVRSGHREGYIDSSGEFVWEKDG